MILVAGHAIPFRFDRLHNDEGWYLKHFQQGDGPQYLAHVRHAVDLTARDPGVLLMFAGGQTDRFAGPRSEGQGYWLIADHYDWFGDPEVRARATTEEFSCDSFENLLFGICRFREYLGCYPDRVTVVGWRFKEARFRFHAECLRLAPEQFHYEGVNDPDELDTASRFEAQRLQVFRADPYGAGEEPTRKRVERNAFRRQHGYLVSCPEVAQLLQHRGPDLFRGSVPWRAT
jgi:hypothetical protein